MIDIEEKDSQCSFYRIKYEECQEGEEAASTNELANYTSAELFKMQSDLIFALNDLKKEKQIILSDPLKKQKIAKLHLYNDLKVVSWTLAAFYPVYSAMYFSQLETVVTLSCIYRILVKQS